MKTEPEQSRAYVARNLQDVLDASERDFNNFKRACKALFDAK